jgi:spectinomycin phosphotransferase
MNPSDLAHAFGFLVPLEGAFESIYPYAPVYRLRDDRGDWILKRTQKPLDRARAVASWTQDLAARRLSVVTPAHGFGENPRGFQPDHDLAADDEVWVVYPFIAGEPYPEDGDTVQIHAAGDLLGAIHAIGTDVDFGLKQSETVVAVEPVEIEQDTAAILGHVRAAYPEAAAAAQTALAERSQRYFGYALPALLEARLPLTNCSWDYKASNLIYPTPASPVLVDPDNAGRIPRTYDLAIAALLFHNEGMGPSRVFTSSEWEAFLGGYLQHVQFTEEEQRAWDDLLLCAWMDEALWLLQDDGTGWADTRQSQLLLSLLLADLSTLTLPR